MSYDGSEDATRDRVRRYLKENYVDTDDTPLSDARLTQLLADHHETLTRGHPVPVPRPLRRRPDRRSGRAGPGRRPRAMTPRRSPSAGGRSPPAATPLRGRGPADTARRAAHPAVGDGANRWPWSLHPGVDRCIPPGPTRSRKGAGRPRGAGINTPARQEAHVPCM